MLYLIKEWLDNMQKLIGKCEELSLTTWEDMSVDEFAYRLSWFVDDNRKSVTIRLSRYDVMILLELSDNRTPLAKSLGVPTHPEQVLMDYLAGRFAEKIKEAKLAEVN